ncbi:Holliday junction resolvase RuvX [Brumimicrobium sp.]|uniref:Holliday junction resolvase RuvX n=1 Tax=Brumimicrobium sp. TaxID=2029867 RepID=UPI00261915C4|nr:Holliday junction resolvase RuvX [uncultured Brumimicrobium sp.]
MKRILGIDFGMKRTGIAITDENNIIASGLTTVPTRELMDFLIRTVKEKNVGTLVLGEPKRLNMEDSHSSQNVRLFREALEKQFPALQIEMMDERFTSKMALESLIAGGVSKKKRQQKELIDEVSATIILQSYMSTL